MKKIFLLTASTFFFLCAKTQQYTLNGSALQTNCHCYVLTNNVNNQSGSVWNNYKIDLTSAFDFVFSVNLGCNDSPGADGIVFVLQPISTSVGTTGQGMGFGGVVPSVGVTLDTYQNGNDADPWYDHVAIQKNGDVNHSSANNLAGPVQMSATSANVEDCQDHLLRIKWDPSIYLYEVYFDGTLRISATIDMITNVFGNNPMVYWGFTGATGGEYNVQKFCTALNPSWTFSPTQTKCVNEPITFNNTSTSFSTIVKTYWNFGDGSNIDSANASPTHTYTTAGSYTVTQRVRGADGCEETNTQTVVIGSKPIASFTYNDSCLNNTVTFTNTTSNPYGNVTAWYWNLDNGGPAITTSIATTTYATPGIKNIAFAVKSEYGCQSDTLHRPIFIYDRPVTNFSYTDSVCLGSSIQFTDLSSPAASVNYWAWQYDDSTGLATAQNPSHVFTTAGSHTVSLVTSVTGSNACPSSTITKNVFIAAKPIAAIKNFAQGCINSNVILQDSSYTVDGLSITSWWWDLGNGNTSTQASPQTSYNSTGIKTIKLVVRNNKGCISDTLIKSINIAPKPVAAFNVGSLLCNNSNVTITDASTVSPGNIAAWDWIFNNATIGTQQNLNYSFSNLTNTIGLAVVSNAGCKSDTLYKTFSLKQKPQIAMQFLDTCKNATVVFTGSENTSIGIRNWVWNFGDGSSGSTNPASHVYPRNGTYTIQLFATGANGCATDTISGALHIYGTNASAGPDLIAATGQPIQLQATGGVSYIWSPTTGLDTATSAHPIATLYRDQTYYLTAYTPTGCESYDTLNIKVYNGPEIYVPGAFTPNGDGKNDILKAIPVGIVKFISFNVYNRYGQLLFTTSDPSKGWSGKWKGEMQATGTFVWVASGVDYLGKLVFRKGSVILVN